VPVPGGRRHTILSWFGQRAVEALALLRTRTARQAFLIAAVNFASAILRFVVTILMAKILSPEGWGNVAVFIALMDVISILCDSGVNATLVRFVAAEADSRATTIFGRCFSIKSANAATLVLVLWVLRRPILENQQFPQELHWLYPVAIAAGVLLSFHSLALSMFQAKQEFGRYSFTYLSVNTVRMLGLGTLLMLGTLTLPAVTASFFSAPAADFALALALLFLTLRRSAALPRPAVSLSAMLLFMAPLALMNAITIGNMRVSNFMLKTLASPEAVANYELAYQIGFVFPLLTSALFTVLLPRVSAMQSRDELRSYRARLLRMYPIVLGMTLAGVLIGPWFIAVVFGAKYAASLAIVRLLIIGFGIHIITQPMSLVFYAVSRPAYLTAIYFAQFAVIVVLNYFFIPRWGGMGAALAVLIATLLAVFAIITLSGWVIRTLPRDPMAAD